jgi:hypothetical protein
MKKNLVCMVAAILVLAACKNGSNAGTEGSADSAVVSGNEIATNQAAPAQRYQIKSGCVTYKGPMGVIQKLYFENYGAMEVFTTEIEMFSVKSKDIQIRKEGYQYSYKDGETTGVKSRWITNDVNYTTLDMEQMKEYKIKDMGTESIAGKECKKYSAEFGSTPVTTWIWNNIMIKTVTNIGSGDLVVEATKIEEGPVDAAIFEVPSGVTFKEQ